MTTEEQILTLPGIFDLQGYGIGSGFLVQNRRAGTRYGPIIEITNPTSDSVLLVLKWIAKRDRDGTWKIVECNPNIRLESVDIIEPPRMLGDGLGVTFTQTFLGICAVIPRGSALYLNPDTF